MRRQRHSLLCALLLALLHPPPAAATESGGTLCSRMPKVCDGTYTDDTGDMYSRFSLCAANPAARRSATVPLRRTAATASRRRHLQDTELSGTVPTEIGRLTKLENSVCVAVPAASAPGPRSPRRTRALPLRRSLRANRLSGTIPSQLGLLTKLRFSMCVRRARSSGTPPSPTALVRAGTSTTTS